MWRADWSHVPFRSVPSVASGVRWDIAAPDAERSLCQVQPNCKVPGGPPPPPSLCHFFLPSSSTPQRAEPKARTARAVRVEERVAYLPGGGA